MSFSFSKFTPSVAGETTGEILDIIAYLAQLRNQNNEVAAANFDISAKAASANAMVSEESAKNDGKATEQQALGQLSQGIATIAPEGLRGATFLGYRGKLNDLSEKAENIAQHEENIKKLANPGIQDTAEITLQQAAQAKNLNPEEEKALLSKLDPRFDFTKKSDGSLNEAIAYAAMKANNGTDLPVYRKFLKRLDSQKKEVNEQRSSAMSDKREWNDLIRNVGQSAGYMAQGGTQLAQARIQEDNAINKAKQTYGQFITDAFRALQDTQYKLGDTLSSSVQSTIQTLLGGLGSANRA